MGTLDPDGLHERGDVVGEQLSGARAVGFAGPASTTQVNRDAGVVLGIVGHLERVAGLVQGEIGDEYQRIPGSLRLVVDVDVAGADCGHGPSLLDASASLGL